MSCISGGSASPGKRCFHWASLAVICSSTLFVILLLYLPKEFTGNGFRRRFDFLGKRVWARPRISPSAHPPPATSADGTRSFMVILCKSAPENFQRRRVLRQLLGAQLKRLEDEEDANPPRNAGGNATATRDGDASGRSALRSTAITPSDADVLCSPGHQLHSMECAKLLRFYFVVGKLSLQEDISQELRTESSTFSDLLLGEFPDSYHRLTRKLLWMMRWLKEMVKFDFALLIDDDVFIDLAQITRALWTGPRKNVYAGGSSANARSPVVRTANHRWYVPKEVYPPDTFPPYHVGVGIALSEDVVHNCLPLAESMPVFGIDDAFLGILMEKCGVKPSQMRSILKMSSRCLPGTQPVIMGNMPADVLIKVTYSFTTEPGYTYTC